MPIFKYKAMDRDGMPARGNLDAANEVDLELRLKRIGLDLITCRETARNRARRGKIRRSDLVTFCFHMEQITRSGIPLFEGLRDLRETTENPALRQVSAAILEDVEGGKTFSQALAAHPEVFDAIFVNLVRAGEQTGRLPDIFENLAATLKWQDELISHTRRLLIYPASVFLIVLAAVVFLLIYLVPQLVTLIRNMGVDLPLQTRVLVWLSELVTGYWPLLFGIPILSMAAVVWWVRRSERARYQLDYFILRIPAVGSILEKIVLARFSSIFALMYRSGITVLDALRACEDVVGNRVISEALRRAGHQINAGEGLTESFRNTGIFPPLVVRMLAVGETTGALDTSLENVNYFYSREVRESIEKGLKLLEPALTVLLGVIIASIMFAVLMPIYDILVKLDF